MAETVTNLPQSLEQQLALLKTLADRPLTLPPIFVDITGSHTAGLLLSQCVYWTKKNLEKDPSSNGWFWVLLPKLQDQLRMGKHALEAARKEVKRLGFLEDELRGVPPKLFLRIDLLKVLGAVNLQLSQNRIINSPVPVKSRNVKIAIPKPENNPPQTGKSIIPEPENLYKEQETQEQENLKEITQEREKAAPVENLERQKKQANLDTWDLRRWREAMAASQPQVGSHAYFLEGEEAEEFYLQRQRSAAYIAGISLHRLHRLLKQFFPDDPNIDKLIPEEPLFKQPKPAESEDDIRQAIERSLPKTGSGA